MGRLNFDIVKNGKKRSERIDYVKERILVSGMSPSTLCSPKRRDSNAFKSFDNDKEIIRAIPIEFSDDRNIKASLTSKCINDGVNNTKDQNNNIKIQISNYIKLSSDIKPKEQDYAFELSRIKAEFNLTEFERKKKKFVESQQKWEREKLEIKKCMEIDYHIFTNKNILSEQLANPFNIHEEISKLNKLYWKNLKMLE